MTAEEAAQVVLYLLQKALRGLDYAQSNISIQRSSRDPRALVLITKAAQYEIKITKTPHSLEKPHEPLPRGIR